MPFCGTTFTNGGSLLRVDQNDSAVENCPHAVYTNAEYLALQDQLNNSGGATLPKEDIDTFIGIAVAVWGLAWLFKLALDFLLNRK